MTPWKTPAPPQRRPVPVHSAPRGHQGEHTSGHHKGRNMTPERHSHRPASVRPVPRTPGQTGTRPTKGWRLTAGKETQQPWPQHPKPAPAVPSITIPVGHACVSPLVFYITKTPLVRMRHKNSLSPYAISYLLSITCAVLYLNPRTGRASPPTMHSHCHGRGLAMCLKT